MLVYQTVTNQNVFCHVLPPETIPCIYKSHTAVKNACACTHSTYIHEKSHQDSFTLARASSWWLRVGCIQLGAIGPA